MDTPVDVISIEVTAFSRSKALAGLSDPQITQTFRHLISQEISLYQGTRVDINATAQGLRVSNGQQQVTVDKVLAAMGRRPNIDQLGLENLGVPLDNNGFPPVDRNTQQIADLPVFLSGDANGKPALLPEAAFDGHIAGINALAAGQPYCFQRRIALNIVFSDPNVAVVGTPYSQLDGNRLITGEVDFSRQGRARTAEHHKGRLRLYADNATGRLLGAELCSPAGGQESDLATCSAYQAEALD